VSVLMSPGMRVAPREVRAVSLGLLDGEFRVAGRRRTWMGWVVEL
jgi:hypothetical protein